MLTVRKSQDRGYADHGWLKAHHSFSFADYYDPLHMGWGNLRVINEDYVEPNTGFGMHAHKNMEIISYVMSGEMSHKDSMGNITRILASDVQRMSAGSGIMHSELNQSNDQTIHALQIWIYPNKIDVVPSYEQKTILAKDKRGLLRLIASPDGAQDSLVIQADAWLYAGLFDAQEQTNLTLAPNRKAYVHVVFGALEVNGQRLHSGDALLLNNETTIHLCNGNQAEVLVFNLTP